MMNIEDLAKELAVIYYEGVADTINKDVAESVRPDDFELKVAEWVREQADENWKDFVDSAEAIIDQFKE